MASWLWGDWSPTCRRRILRTPSQGRQRQQARQLRPILPKRAIEGSSPLTPETATITVWPARRARAARVGKVCRTFYQTPAVAGGSAACFGRLNKARNDSYCLYKRRRPAAAREKCAGRQARDLLHVADDRLFPRRLLQHG